MDRLLARILPPGLAAEEIRGDLAEEHARLRVRRGAVVAAVWYGVEAATMAAGAAWEEGLMGFVRDDLRIALRGLARNRGFTAVAVVTLALGLGANAAIFSVLRAVVLTPLPFERPERLVALRQRSRDTGEGAWMLSFPQYEDFVERQRAYSALGAFQVLEPSLTGEEGQPPRRIEAMAATHGLLPLLGVEPAMGRGIAADEDAIGGPRTAVVSHRFWRGVLGGDPAVLGRSLTLDGDVYRVVGVLPEGFHGQVSRGVLPDADADVWIPYRNSQAAGGLTVRGLTNVSVVARLADGVDPERASEDAERVMTELREIHPEHAHEAVFVVPARDVVVEPVASRMALLLGAVALVFLVACTNVAGLVMGRTSARLREISVRSALGAGRGRLARLLLAESALLAGGGAALGALLAFAALRALLAIDPGSIPRLGASAVDATTALVLVAGAAGVAVILAAVGVSQTRTSVLTKGLSESARGTPAGRGSLTRKGLVVVQVAAAVVLLNGAGLLGRSLYAALGVDPGFRTEGLLTARIVLSDPFVSPRWPRHVAFFGELTRRLGELPGVESASAAYLDPLDAGWTNAFLFVGRPAPEQGRRPQAEFRPVLPGFFATAGIGVRAGRAFTDADDDHAPGVAIVNQAFVRAFFGDGDPLGARLDYGNWWRADTDPEYEIVGVVADVHSSGPTEPVRPVIYFPHAQQPVREMALLVRTAGDPAALAPEVRRVVAELDPTVPVDGATTMAAKLEAKVGDRRFLAALLTFFATAALVLAAVGLYGILSFLVLRRSREIGIRLALGERRGEVVRGVLVEGLGLVLVGVAVGLPVALGLARALRRLLFGVGPADPGTTLAAPLVLLAVGLAACAVPALRATRVDPLEALRTE